MESVNNYFPEKEALNHPARQPTAWKIDAPMFNPHFPSSSFSSPAIYPAQTYQYVWLPDAYSYAYYFPAYADPCIQQPMQNWQMGYVVQPQPEVYSREADFQTKKRSGFVYYLHNTPSGRRLPKEQEKQIYEIECACLLQRFDEGKQPLLKDLRLAINTMTDPYDRLSLLSRYLRVFTEHGYPQGIIKAIYVEAAELAFVEIEKLSKTAFKQKSPIADWAARGEEAAHLLFFLDLFNHLSAKDEEGQLFLEHMRKQFKKIDRECSAPAYFTFMHALKNCSLIKAPEGQDQTGNLSTCVSKLSKSLLQSQELKLKIFAPHLLIDGKLYQKMDSLEEQFYLVCRAALMGTSEIDFMENKEKWAQLTPALEKLPPSWKSHVAQLIAHKILKENRFEQKISDYFETRLYTLLEPLEAQFALLKELSNQPNLDQAVAQQLYLQMIECARKIRQDPHFLSEAIKTITEKLLHHADPDLQESYLTLLHEIGLWEDIKQVENSFDSITSILNQKQSTIELRKLVQKELKNPSDILALYHLLVTRNLLSLFEGAEKFRIKLELFIVLEHEVEKQTCLCRELCDEIEQTSDNKIVQAAFIHFIQLSHCQKVSSLPNRFAIQKSIALRANAVLAQSEQWDVWKAFKIPPHEAEEAFFILKNADSLLLQDVLSSEAVTEIAQRILSCLKMVEDKAADDFGSGVVRLIEQLASDPQHRKEALEMTKCAAAKGILLSQPFVYSVTFSVIQEYASEKQWGMAAKELSLLIQRGYLQALTSTDYSSSGQMLFPLLSSLLQAGQLTMVSAILQEMNNTQSAALTSQDFNQHAVLLFDSFAKLSNDIQALDLMRSWRVSGVNLQQLKDKQLDMAAFNLDEEAVVALRNQLSSTPDLIEELMKRVVFDFANSHSDDVKRGSQLLKRLESLAALFDPEKEYAYHHRVMKALFGIAAQFQGASLRESKLRDTQYQFSKAFIKGCVSLQSDDLDSTAWKAWIIISPYISAVKTIGKSEKVYLDYCLQLEQKFLASATDHLSLDLLVVQVAQIVDQLGAVFKNRKITSAESEKLLIRLVDRFSALSKSTQDPKEQNQIIQISKSFHTKMCTKDHPLAALFSGDLSAMTLHFLHFFLQEIDFQRDSKEKSYVTLLTKSLLNRFSLYSSIQAQQNLRKSIALFLQKSGTAADNDTQGECQQVFQEALTKNLFEKSSKDLENLLLALFEHGMTQKKMKDISRSVEIWTLLYQAEIFSHEHSAQLLIDLFGKMLKENDSSWFREGLSVLENLQELTLSSKTESTLFAKINEAIRFAASSVNDPDNAASLLLFMETLEDLDAGKRKDLHLNLLSACLQAKNDLGSSLVLGQLAFLDLSNRITYSEELHPVIACLEKQHASQFKTLYIQVCLQLASISPSIVQNKLALSLEAPPQQQGNELAAIAFGKAFEARCIYFATQFCKSPSTPDVQSQTNVVNGEFIQFLGHAAITDVQHLQLERVKRTLFAYLARASLHAAGESAYVASESLRKDLNQVVGSISGLEKPIRLLYKQMIVCTCDESIHLERIETLLTDAHQIQLFDESSSDLAFLATNILIHFARRPDTLDNQIRVWNLLKDTWKVNRHSLAIILNNWINEIMKSHLEDKKILLHAQTQLQKNLSSVAETASITGLSKTLALRIEQLNS